LKPCAVLSLANVIRNNTVINHANLFSFHVYNTSNIETNYIVFRKKSDRCRWYEQFSFCITNESGIYL